MAAAKWPLVWMSIPVGLMVFGFGGWHLYQDHEDFHKMRAVIIAAQAAAAKQQAAQKP